MKMVIPILRKWTNYGMSATLQGSRRRHNRITQYKDKGYIILMNSSRLDGKNEKGIDAVGSVNQLITFPALGHLGNAFTPGLVIMMMVAATGHLSMAHLNPAVTLAFALTGHFPWREAPIYIGGQMIAALLAAAILRLLFGDENFLRSHQSYREQTRLGLVRQQPDAGLRLNQAAAVTAIWPAICSIRSPRPEGCALGR